MKPATCHPDKKHYSKGLCVACYSKTRRENPTSFATCHPDRGHHARGLCPPCYEKERNDQKRPYLTRYGITVQEYDERLKAQNYRCASCQIHQDDSDRAFAVDHDHNCCPTDQSCGECIRGLLCRQCNVALGFLGDDINRIMALGAYVLQSQNLLTLKEN